MSDNEPPIAQEKPKIEQPGNAAAMREALKLCVDSMCEYCHMRPYCCGDAASGCEALRVAKAALAAPARNCDRFAKWHEAWDAFVAEYGGPTDPGETEYYFGVWLFAQAEGGAE